MPALRLTGKQWHIESTWPPSLLAKIVQYLTANVPDFAAAQTADEANAAVAAFLATLTADQWRSLLQHWGEQNLLAVDRT